jgi:hypothetical protein
MPSQFDKIAELLARGTELALEECIRTLEMENPETLNGDPHPNYIKIKALKSKAASDILGIRTRVDGASMKGRNYDRTAAVLKVVNEYKGAKAN